MKKNKKFLLSLIISILLFLGYNFLPANVINTITGTPSSPSNSAYVMHVVDGDTLKIKINGKVERLRMLGIDTPESVHPDPNKNTEAGKMASNFTKSQLEGKNITLEYDVEMHDNYGRILAYVYYNGEMFNETLLREGYAKVLTVSPNRKYEERFRSLETMAKLKKIGIWKK